LLLIHSTTLEQQALPRTYGTACWTHRIEKVVSNGAIANGTMSILAVLPGDAVTVRVPDLDQAGELLVAGLLITPVPTWSRWGGG
jgi:hypothetical protein